MRLLLLFFILCPVLVTGQNIEGYWTGSIDVQGISLRLAFTINVSGDTLLTTMDSPDQEVFGIPVQSTYTNDDTLRFEMPNASIKYEGVLDSSGRYIGMFNQGGMAFPLNLEKTEEKQLGNKRPQEPKKPYPYSEEMVVFLNETDGIKLAGTLTIPKEQASYPAVVLISGSGAQNRDEAILGHKPFLVLADHLTRNGIAVLRYDDRGTAESEGDFTSSTAYDFSKDAEAAFNYLKSRKEIDSNRIGLIGHSEGGMVAPMVAARNSECKVRFSLITDVLKNYVDFDIRITNGAQYLISNTGRIRDTNDSELRLIAIKRNTSNRWSFHGIVLIHFYEGSRPLFETTEYSQWHLVFTCKFHRPELQHLRTHAGHFQHLFKRDAFQSLCTVNDARIGRVNAINVGVDLTFIRTHSSGQSNR